jgi:hypothetical protein
LSFFLHSRASLFSAFDDGNCQRLDDEHLVCALKLDLKKLPDEVVAVTATAAIAVVVTAAADFGAYWFNSGIDSWRLLRGLPATDGEPELLLHRFGGLASPDELELSCDIDWLFMEDHRRGGRTGDSWSKSSW